MQIVIGGIAGLALIVAACIAAMARNARRPQVLWGVVLSMAIQFLLAASGLLRQWNRTPPPLMPLLLILFALTVWLAFSPIGSAISTQTPLWILIAFQSFRLPLELVLHHAATIGIMPGQMTFTGYNFDILTGITALPVAWLASRQKAPPWLLVGWNLLGSVLLAAIVTIAVISLPAIAAFGPGNLNTWIADAPFIWLPGVLVQAALLGHILLWRRIG